jgi:hypothetical protein
MATNVKKDVEQPYTRQMSQTPLRRVGVGGKSKGQNLNEIITNDCFL